ncbi:MAG TPA: protein phosphatase 2C domain-containing protein [Gemmatimonadales bacterium]|nr:protein phosphatase 2C domain-containing protein [Gemmatimonadales bacterium]
MTVANLRTASVPPSSSDRPRDAELDLFGLTHPGKVRKENQDHFLLCTVHPQVVVHGTSLPEPEHLPLRGERLATIMLVADGVGGSTSGADASQLTIESIMRYVASSLRCYHAAGSTAEGELLDALRAATLEAHAAVCAESVARNQEGRMATTLTLAIGVWPWMYVVQVGDSRCYHFWQGALRQVTRDQTMAQDLVDQGALPPERLASSPLSHVLAGAIGGREATPVVTRFEIPRGVVILLCSDGLTKHVSNAEIEEQIRGMSSSEQLCRSLLDLALERGGSDNVTVLAGRAAGTR